MQVAEHGARDPGSDWQKHGAHLVRTTLAKRGEATLAEPGGEAGGRSWRGLGVAKASPPKRGWQSGGRRRRLAGWTLAEWQHKR